MFKQSRLFFSAIMIAIIFFSTLILPVNTSAKTKKCPIELPRTILSLYLQSDAVVIAELKSEEITKTENEDENGYYAAIKRNLNVINTLKGRKSPEISFTKSEYKRVLIKSETSENGTNEVYLDESEAYNRSAELTVGKTYLVFLTKDADSDELYPADYRFFSREITQDNAGIYENHLKELSKILANKKNQLPDLAEWLVDLTEDEVTRWDGATTLARSFESLKYAEEAAEESDAPQKKITTIDGDFNEYSDAIANQITEAQKQRLSSTFINLLNQSLLGGEKESDYDYDFAELVGNWDRERFAMYGYSLLLAIDKSDVKKTSRAMNFVANTINDTSLSEIYYQYTEVQQDSESQSNEESDRANHILNGTDVKEPQIEKVEQNTEVINETLEVKEQVQTEISESQEEILTEVQAREQILQKFMNRYQELLVRNFTPEVETEVETATSEIITQ